MRKQSSRKRKEKGTKISVNALVLLTTIAPFLRGTFLYAAIALVFLVTAVCFLQLVISQRKVTFYANCTSLFFGIIFLSGILPLFIEPGKGDIVWGLFKLLAIAAFALLAMQYEEAERDVCYSWLPYTAAAMVLMSALLFMTPARSFVFEGRRLAGLFQYCNSFALYLLLALIVHLERYKNAPSCRLKDMNCKQVITCLCFFVCLFGIAWTGSRVTLVMTVACLIYYSFKNKIHRKVMLTVIAGLVGILLAVGFLTAGQSAFGRLVTISTGSSTLLGRLLYVRDALPLLVKKPLGLGFLGYSHIVPQIQTGVYTLRYVHNEYLQAALDYGDIGGIAFLLLLLFGIVRQRGWKQIVLLAFAFHIIFDFDLQFLSLCFFLCLALPLDEGRKFSFEGNRTMGFRLGSIAAICLAAYFSLFGFMFRLGRDDFADQIYPVSSEARAGVMLGTTDKDTAVTYAKKVLAMNPYAYQAYDVLSTAAGMDGNASKQLSYEWESVQLAIYHPAILQAFGQMLDEAETSGNAGLAEEAKMYREKLDTLIEKTKERTSPLAYRLNDKPDFTY